MTNPVSQEDIRTPTEGDGQGTQSELDVYKEVFRKEEAVCREAASGNLEARVTDIEGFGELSSRWIAINKLLDLTDAFVREAGVSLEYASRGKYFRRFLLRGMLGSFRAGAEIITTACGAMEENAR